MQQRPADAAPAERWSAHRIQHPTPLLGDRPRASPYPPGTGLWCHPLDHAGRVPLEAPAPHQLVAGEVPPWREYRSKQIWAAVVLQKHWRGLCSRRAEARRATAYLGLLCRRHPSLTTAVAAALDPAIVRRARARRPSGRPASGAVAPQQMNAEMRLKRLKAMFTTEWARVVDEVDSTHAAYLQRLGQRLLNDTQQGRLLRTVRDETFVHSLPEDVCLQANFFSPDQHKLSLCNRVFLAPRQDLEMNAAEAPGKRRRA